MKNHILIAILLCSSFFFGCNKTPDLVIEEANLIFPVKQPIIQLDPNVFIDKVTKLLYLYDQSTAKLLTFNYQSLQTRRQSKKLADCCPNNPLGIGTYKGASEIYYVTETRKSIKILDGITLAVKDSIEVFDSADSRIIADIQSASNNLIVLTTCYEKSIFLDRAIKRIVSLAESESCLNLRTYTNKATNLIGIIRIGLGNGFEPVPVSLEKYDFSGKLLESHTEPKIDKANEQVITTNDNIDYFITGQKLLSKNNLSEVGFLNESYKDIVISEDGENLYGLSEDGHQINVINFSTKTFERIIELENPALRLFLDDGFLIVLYYTYSSVGISKIRI